MPAFNTITKATSVKSSLTSIGSKGNVRDKIGGLSGAFNGVASIIDDFNATPPGEGVSFSNSRLIPAGEYKFDSGYLKFPEELGTTEYPAWVEITVYKRAALGSAIVNAFSNSITSSEVNKAKEKAASASAAKSEPVKPPAQATVKDEKSVVAEVQAKLSGAVDFGAGILAGAGAAANFKKGLDNFATVSHPILIVAMPIQAGMGADNRSVQVNAEELGMVGGSFLKQGARGFFSGGNIKAGLKAFGVKAAFKMPFGVGNALKVMTGTVENPYSYQIFKGVNHRSFTMTWNIVPKSEEEASSLLKMKEKLSYHMMPSNDGFLLTVPDEFKIRYMHLVKQGDGPDAKYVAEENKFYPKTMGCYLSQCDYIPNDQGDSIHNDGAPVSMQFQLTFQEIEVLDKQRLDSNSYKGTGK